MCNNCKNTSNIANFNDAGISGSELWIYKPSSKSVLELNEQSIAREFIASNKISL